MAPFCIPLSGDKPLFNIERHYKKIGKEEQAKPLFPIDEGQCKAFFIPAIPWPKMEPLRYPSLSETAHGSTHQPCLHGDVEPNINDIPRRQIIFHLTRSVHLPGYRKLHDHARIHAGLKQNPGASIGSIQQLPSIAVHQPQSTERIISSGISEGRQVERREVVVRAGIGDCLYLGECASH